MPPLGYVVPQPGVRLSKPVRVQDHWINWMPAEYRTSLLGEREPPAGLRPSQDPHCLATLNPHRSLVAMAQEARKPIFALTVADGAIGNHAAAARNAYGDCQVLARRILQGIADLQETPVAADHPA